VGVGNLSGCYHRTGEYATALTFDKAKHSIIIEAALELKLSHVQVGAIVEIHSQKSPELIGVRGSEGPPL